MKYLQQRLILVAILLAATIYVLAAEQSTQPITKTVKQDGTGDFTTIQAAVDAVPDRNKQPYIINIAPGRYEERVLVPHGRDFMTLRGTGTDRTEVLLTGAKGEGAVLRVNASDFRAENFTVENTAGPTAGPQQALYGDGKRQVFENLLIKGWQDTLGSWNGHQAYFRNCEVWGSVDFIYSGGTAVFDRCRITQIRETGGPVAAPSTPPEVPYGFVFLDCRLVKGPGVKTDSSTLMRPWRPYGATAYINCVMEDHITAKGWSEWDGRENTCRAAEYGSKTPDGQLIDLSQRAPWVKRLTAHEAGQYTVANIFPDWSSWPQTTSADSSTTAATPATGSRWSDTADGFASVNALGQNGTTGGRGGQTVTIRTQADLERYLAMPEPYVIRVQGTLPIQPFGKKMRVSSHKTIIGVGADATILHGGFRLLQVSNVIIRNLTVRDSYVEGDARGKTNDYDAVQMDDCHHIWIDHCHFSHMGDGIIDLRKNSDYVTVSWSILSRHNKVFGVGWNPNVGALHVTIHHTWFRDTTQRNPSLDNGTGHLYNNYLQNVSSYGNFARGRTKMVVENSVFHKVNNPLQCDTNAELVSRGNIVVNSPGRNEAKGSAFDPRRFYEYTLDDAASVPELLKAGAGPQADIGV